MFDGIIIGSATGVISTPTLQSVTNSGNETTNGISVEDIALNDDANASYAKIKVTDYRLRLTQNTAGFSMEYASAANTNLVIRNNGGAVLTDVSIRVFNVVASSVVGAPNTCEIPNPWGVRPDFITVVANNNLAAQFLGASNFTGQGGYQCTANDTTIFLSATVPSPDDTDLMDFNFLAYFIPA